MIVYGACYVIQLCSIEEIAEASKKYYAKIAKLFGTGFFCFDWHKLFYSDKCCSIADQSWPNEWTRVIY